MRKRRVTRGEALSLNVDETASAIGISRAYLYLLLKDGKAPRSFVVGKRRLFPVSEIHTWLAEQVDNAA